MKKKTQDLSRLHATRPHCRLHNVELKGEEKNEERMAVGNATTTQSAVQIMMIVCAAVPVLMCMWSNAIDSFVIFVNTLDRFQFRFFFAPLISFALLFDSSLYFRFSSISRLFSSTPETLELEGKKRKSLLTISYLFNVNNVPLYGAADIS